MSGWEQWLVKVSWLGGLVPVIWWVELALDSLKGSAMKVVCFGMSMGLVWFLEGFLPMGRVVFLFC